MATPIKIVDVEEAVQAGGTEAPETGTKFCFNEVQLLKFKDGTSYHVQKQRATIIDEKLIKNLTEAAKIPTNKIFIES